MILSNRISIEFDSTPSMRTEQPHLLHHHTYIDLSTNVNEDLFDLCMNIKTNIVIYFSNTVCGPYSKRKVSNKKTDSSFSMYFYDFNISDDSEL